VKVCGFGKIGPSSCMVVLQGSSFVVYMFVDLTTSVPEVVYFYYNHSPWGLMVSPDLDHEVHLKLVLELLKKKKLFAKFSKYEFWLQEVRFLGHVVNNNDVHVDSSREQEEAFQTLKDNLCNAPILSLPDGPEDFVAYRDASNQ
ncbi:hypothetical protein Tco_1389091, partial [Tanacetum coccineum]